LGLPNRTIGATQIKCDVPGPILRITSRTGRIATIVVLILGVSFSLVTPLSAVSNYETELRFFAGEYEQCEEIARAEVERGVWNELWPELLIRSLLARGQYEQAQQAFETSLRRYSDRIAYRLLGDTVYRYANEPEKADEQLAAIYQLVQRSPWRYGSWRDRVTLGRYFHRQGEDARQILELIYDRVRAQNAQYPEVYIATAELALEKHDYALAAEQLATAAELQPTNPKIFYLTCLAWRERDGEKATAALRRALEINPRHVPSLLLQVDQLVDAEQYDLAEDVLEQILAINLREPRAWAYHAVIAHLQGHYEGENALREAALTAWSTNPEVDYLIGLKLSQKYRFREAVAYQRQALEYQPQYLRSQFQLANDLLRLGDEAEGWQLADRVQQRDNYHVEAYNLVTLREQLDKFSTLTSEHFVVRMEAKEAAIYGPQVLELLEEAYTTLCPKYDIALGAATQVEIFTRQQDFAIRTFGLPGGAGYLGVCFGSLITANSPASQGDSPTNWKSVLWHEFCHVVTLQKTQNRMPRWLSEGISVYEERQRVPAWGQTMTPAFREMILGDAVTPVSELSGAFLQPPSPLHLQFAYYESSLVVEYLIEKIGLDGLCQILDDLAVGMPINEALGRHAGGIQAVDQEFAAYERSRAESLAPDLDWESVELPDDASLPDVVKLLADTPNNFWLLQAAAGQAIQSQRWSTATTYLKQIHEAYPEESAADGPTRMLARCYRELGELEAEKEVLRTLAEHDADAIDVFRRLMELAATDADWATVDKNARRIIAVNPMVFSAQEQLARAALEQNDPVSLIAAQQALLQSDPPDPALAYYRLARANQQLGNVAQAKRNVMKALEEAPRYRDAHRLLIELVGGAESTVIPQQSDSNLAGGQQEEEGRARGPVDPTETSP